MALKACANSPSSSFGIDFKSTLVSKFPSATSLEAVTNLFIGMDILLDMKYAKLKAAIETRIVIPRNAIVVWSITSRYLCSKTPI